MNSRKHFNTLIVSLLVLALAMTQSSVFAKSEKGRATDNERQRYIVTFMDPPLAAYDGRPLDMPERGSEIGRAHV